MTDPAYSDGCAWIEGDYYPLAKARIPIVDVGFTRSDVTYDVVAVWEGQFFRLEAHLDRFHRSMSILQMELELSREDITAILMECLRRSGIRNAYVELIATRGTPPAVGGRDPRLFTNRFYALVMPYVWIVNPEIQDGADLIVARETLRIPPTSVDPTVKNFHWGDLTRGMQEATSRGGTHAVLLDRDGHVTEGPGFNIFVVKGGTLSTPESGVLHGITRDTALVLAGEFGLECVVAPMLEEALHDADEIFLTSTAGGIMPVRTIDGTGIGSSVPGPVTKRIHDRYWREHQDSEWTTAVNYE
jgi:branched-chain amino acid aminotransferase